MNRCPITYHLCGNVKYSPLGLKLLSPKLQELQDFPFTAKEQRELALQQASKISIQGVQPKLSVKLYVAKGEFELVEKGGTFIFKPPHQIFDELPQNEDFTMRLASLVGLEVPLHGMIYNRDGSLTYFIRRFDRLPRGRKVAVEDFSQLMGFSRDTKYEASMEKLVPILDKHCTFPLLEKRKLFRLTIIRREGKIELSPAYDLVNSTIVLRTQEELALPLKGKKNRLNYFDLFDYFGKEKLGLSEQILVEEVQIFKNAFSDLGTLLSESFLSKSYQDRYFEVVNQRRLRIAL